MLPDSCVQLKMSKDLQLAEAAEANCSNKYVLGCQGLTTPPPSCFSPSCTVLSCNKKMTYFTKTVDNVTMVLANPQFHGTWHSINGRIYVFSFNASTWQDANLACCSIGMKLLSLDFDYEYNNLLQALKTISMHNATTEPGEFWTSGSDVGCESSFGWCAVNKLVRSTNWAPQQPSDKNKSENCISIAINQNSALLSDDACDRKMRYICESRDTTKSSRSSQAIVDECGAVYNVTRIEAENVLTLSAEYTTKIKCYLKCVGEHSGFMLNGKVVDENMLMMAELLSPKSQPAKLQDNLEAVDSCSSIKGMDECDTAALVFQCGQEKAPDFVSDIITSVERNSSAEKSPLNVTVALCASYGCSLNPTRRTMEYENATVLSASANGGKFFNACSGKRYAVFSASTLYSPAGSLCCQYGLQILTLDTIAKQNCFRDGLPDAYRSGSFHAPLSRMGASNYSWCTSSRQFIMSDFGQNNGTDWQNASNYQMLYDFTGVLNGSQTRVKLRPANPSVKCGVICEP
ncbi:uncharacterized protein LOC132203444 [Neocloeon triangulifer]|uniref:uncharacterized protein LOC132203444 n=1 Tax=Neocloeon triangulifer TaxID=2078957 RepID=UPI00286F4142|nr:uncharacterized protein LOC132203444 [Neocloeon triangulifer]